MRSLAAAVVLAAPILLAAAVALAASTLLAAVALAGENLLPRQGSGWEGFGTGTWVRLKMTRIPKGQVPAVTITTMRLKKRTESTLTLEMIAANPVGMERKTEQVLPRSGEAGPGETAKVEKLEPEPVHACGRTFDCARTRTTVTGPAGKRVITEWHAKEPEVRVKRTEEAFDGKGDAVARNSMVLTSLDTRHKVGKEEVRCLAYSVLRRQGEQEVRAKALVSRDVPGDMVRMDSEVVQDGEVTFTIRLEALDFGVK